MCISSDFGAHGIAKIQFYLLSVDNRKACILVLFSKYRLLKKADRDGFEFFLKLSA
jgi:hypothetical protein